MESPKRAMSPMTDDLDSVEATLPKAGSGTWAPSGARCCTTRHILRSALEGRADSCSVSSRYSSFIAKCVERVRVESGRCPR
eukprot:496622-Amphidinium_carterae.1